MMLGAEVRAEFFYIQLFFRLITFRLLFVLFHDFKMMLGIYMKKSFSQLILETFVFAFNRIVITVQISINVSQHIYN